MLKKLVEYAVVNAVLGITFYGGMYCGIIWDRLILKNNNDNPEYRVDD